MRNIFFVDTAIEDELTSKIDEMSKIAIAYAEAIAEGENPNNAKKAAKQFFKKVNLDKEVILELEDSIDNGFFFLSLIEWERLRKPFVIASVIILVVGCDTVIHI